MKKWFSEYPWLPWVLPFAVYMFLTTAESTIAEALDYRLVYSLKIIIVASLLVMCRSAFPERSTKGIGLGLAAGVIGIVTWLGLVEAQALIPGLNNFVESFLGSRPGFNPFAEEGRSSLAIAFVAVRLIGLVAIVPLMEELFWRGFLVRFLIDDDFQQVPYGKLTTFSFLLVTIGFVGVHPELLAAFAWGALINVLYMRTANLWACITMHATTNALLGTYVLVTGTWSLW